MKVIMTIIFAFLSLILITGEGIAITMDDVQDMTTVTPAQAATEIVGANLVAGTATFTGAPISGGTFINGALDGLGIDRGVILTTGDVLSAISPNTNGMIGTDNKRAGDVNLNAVISPQTTVDAAILQFDYNQPAGLNGAIFDFVFASDEYPEFVGIANDVFAIFVNGVNVARLPGTVTPVSINTLNGTVTPALFNDNSDIIISPFGTQYDGFSRLISATARVTPGSRNSVKIAIADSFDGAVDSAVFLAQARFVDLPNFSISGRIINSIGSPQQGISVSLSGVATALATTNAQGIYTFSNLVPGGYTITPFAAGFIFAPVNRSVTITNANITGQDFITSRSRTATVFSISGNITSGGAGLPGVAVTLTGVISRTVNTSVNGTYSFSDLPNGAYTVTPLLAGFTFTPLSRNVTVNNANVTGVNFTAPPAGGGGTFSISGRVANAIGGPLSNVTVTLSIGANRVTTTNENGDYTFAGLENGSYRVTPSRTGLAFNPVFRNVTINNANVPGQNFTGIRAR